MKLLLGFAALWMPPISEQPESGGLYYVSKWLPFAILGILFAFGIAEAVMTGKNSLMEDGLTMIVLGLGSAALAGFHAVFFANGRLLQEAGGTLSFSPVRPRHGSE